MWGIVKQSSNKDSEPIEIQFLKQQLANLKCKCRSCLEDGPVAYKRIGSLHQNDKEIQAELERKLSFSKCIQVPSNAGIKELAKINPKTVSQETGMCPSCYLTLHLLRGGLTKVLKDEESETKNVIFTCDKSTEEIVDKVEKTTSVTNNSKEETPCKDISRASDDIIVIKKANNEKKNSVTFQDYDSSEWKTLPNSNNKECMCLDGYIDSIRPPFVYM